MCHNSGVSRPSREEISSGWGKNRCRDKKRRQGGGKWDGRTNLISPGGKFAFSFRIESDWVFVGTRDDVGDIR